jgi:hypothetical protein
MKRTALLASFVALAGGAACSRGPTPSADAAPAPAAATSAAAPHSEADLKTLTVDEVDQLIGEKTGKAFIYDNNPKAIFDAGHLPTATWMNFNSVTADVLPKDKAATLVFYCANEA